MSIPCTISRHVRCRVRDWVSCLLACKLPLDEEPVAFCPASLQISTRTAIFYPRSEEAKNLEDRKTKTTGNVNEQHEKEKESVRSLILDNNSRTAEEDTDESSWPRFAEEDYIVFCFKEDGGITMVTDKKKETSDRSAHNASKRRARPVNRKLHYNENIGRAEHSHESRSNMAVEKHIYPIEEVNQTEFKECKMSSIESSDSNQSDASTSSFAFPVLGWEWMESPEKMPKSERTFTKKYKSGSARLRSCRF